MYFVNWQRDIKFEVLDGRKIVVKRKKVTKEFHDCILVGTFAAISIILGHPSLPRFLFWSEANEGVQTRELLKKLGVPTPELISISPDVLIEEYIGYDLYRVLQATSVRKDRLVFLAGQLTGKLHSAGYVFVDNKAENYLVKNNEVVRTDLGFLQGGTSIFSRSMDIASFLASVIDLELYSEVEEEFYRGYKEVTGRGFPYLSIILRNILAPGLSSDAKVTLRNMMKNSDALLA